jgi:hypothetical protein
MQNAKGEMQKAAHAIPISVGATANADYSTGNRMRTQHAACSMWNEQL